MHRRELLLAAAGLCVAPFSRLQAAPPAIPIADMHFHRFFRQPDQPQMPPVRPTLDDAIEIAEKIEI